MKKIEVTDKINIKQLLYAELVLCVKDDQYSSFGGFQLWRFDKKRGVCDCGESHWVDSRLKVTHYELDKAAKILWQHRDCLFVRSRQTYEEKKLQLLTHF